MPASPEPWFDFEAPEDHLTCYADIAVEMTHRWPVELSVAIAAINECVRDVDHFGPYAWLLFHEDPWYWADLYYHLQVLGDQSYRPGSHWGYSPRSASEKSG